jgi:phosphoglycerol transferase MdoB-like AlkP superfamily enzyme
MILTEFTVFIRILKQILWTLLLYFVLRLEFLFWNWSVWYSQYETSTIAHVFLNGLRFDLSTVLTISSVVFVALLIPWPQVTIHLKDVTLRTSLFILQIPFLIANMIDVEFIHFSGRRLTTDSFYLAKEIPGKFLTLMSSYWSLNLLNFFIFSFFIWISFFRKSKFEFKYNPWKNLTQRIITSLLFLILYIIGVRGGLQLKPLEMAHAGTLNDTRLTHLVTNSGFTLIHSLQKERIKIKRDFQSLDDYSKYLNKASSQNNITQALPWNIKPKNVVLFILESFSLEYMGLPNNQEGYTPFLDSLIPKGYFFPYAFANGRRSIEALPSILAGIPSLMDEPFLSSQYITNDIPLLGKLLKEKKIWSGFFHGGQNGTMFFNEFIQRLGFDAYFGANEFPDSTKSDGTWGIWDEPFLQFMAQNLDQINKPFLSVFFSLSSHHPFKIPKEYESTFKEGPLPILKTISYTDASLKKFFETAEKSTWYKDTVFIFTADHTSKSFSSAYNNPLASFRVPLLFYFPGENSTYGRTDNPIVSTDSSTELKSTTTAPETTKLNTDLPVQHIDLLPTLLHIFSIEARTSLLGKSIFTKDQNRQVPLYLDGYYWLVKFPWVALQTKPSEYIFYNYLNDTQLKNPTEPDKTVQSELILKLKASVQYHNNGLLQNSLLEPDSQF